MLARKGWCKVSDVDGGETDPAALRALVASLLALKDKAGGESYARAASILVARIRLESDPFVLRNLVSSLHALADQIEESGFNEAASSLTARLIDAKSAVDVQALARSVAVIEPNVGEDSAAELGSKLVDRVKVERDPELLRAYGAVLGSLPAGSLSAGHIDSIAHIFGIPDAPCEVATRVEGDGNLRWLVRQILKLWTA